MFSASKGCSVCTAKGKLYIHSGDKSWSIFKMQTNTKALWIDDNGRTACSEHGGYYLSTEVESNPDVQMIYTPLTSWMRIPPTSAQGISCEDCK